MTKGLNLGRRAFLSFSAVAAVSAAASPALAAPAITGKATVASTRALSFVNLHTQESGRILYWENGAYLRPALEQVSRALRDPRNNQIHPISPELLDLVTRLGQTLNSSTPFHIISAYRSQDTNDALAARSRGVAKQSYHLSGMAIDLRLPDRPLNQVRGAALQLAAGGVGYYPSSNFVHLDVGPVRRW